MYCAECGNKLVPHNMGTHLQCCKGLGYWWNEPRQERDGWFGAPVEFKGWYLYKNCMLWPSKQKAVPPKLEEV